MVGAVRGRSVTPALADHSPATLAAVRDRLVASGRAQLHDLLSAAYAECLLAVHDAEANVGEAFTPRLNVLNPLTAPAPHSVTQVALSAGAGRVSATGWLQGV